MKVLDELSKCFILPNKKHEIKNMKTETITIIGAGIGGLTTALTLKQKGLNVNIFEGSAEIKPVGAGIILANNAMQVFKKLGIQEKSKKQETKFPI